MGGPYHGPVRTTHLLYLHGFRSSPQSTKARLVARRVATQCPELVWWCPQLSGEPDAAMDLVWHGVASWPRHSMAVIGSSLGGFYASLLANRTGCKAVLLNPAAHPARDLRAHLGWQSQWHDPAQGFTLEPQCIAQLQALEQPGLLHPRQVLGIVAKGDEVLDWREMVAHLRGARLLLLEGGDHALSDFERHLDTVLEFLGLAPL